MKRLVLSELSYKKGFRYNRIAGFTRTQIKNITNHPEKYGDAIIRLSDFMMLNSGYYKRLIEYFVDSAIINWTLDTEIKDIKLFDVNKKTYKKNYVSCVHQVNKFKLENIVHDIFLRLFTEDICYGFITEDEVQCSTFFLDPKFCRLEKLVSGNVYEFSINRSLLTSSYIETLPLELQDIIENSKNTQLDNRVLIPYKNSLCLKYHNEFTYLFPPFFSIISEILSISDYKELAKAKTESDAYKLLFFKIPTNDEDKISMGDELVVPFVQTAQEIVPDSIGIVPSPMEIKLIESKSTTSDDNNKVENAVNNYYTEAGISRSVISSASSGSELKLSMKVDSSDIYRLYHQIESWMNLQLQLRNYIYPSYSFNYRILQTTIYDVDDYLDTQLKLAQASFPVKGEVMAANGMNPAKMIGATIHEDMFDDLFSSWKPMETSYTMSATQEDSDKTVGRPEEEEVTEGTEQQRANDSNKTENRI